MENEQEITLQIHCHHLPGVEFDGKAAVRLGIQQGKDVTEDVPADIAEVTFTVPLRVKRHPSDGLPRFSGAYVQGRPGDQFVYLCWGERLDGQWEGFRRAKVRLEGLDWGRLQVALTTASAIEVSLEMTDAKGGPLCGSVRI